jgi:hypothetical protein
MIATEETAMPFPYPKIINCDAGDINSGCTGIIESKAMPCPYRDINSGCTGMI